MIDGYVAAGYALIWASLLVYAWRTKRRLGSLERELGGGGRGTTDSERTN